MNKFNRYTRKSEVNLYDMCPYRYKLAFIDGIFMDAPAMKRGREIHQLLEDFYKPNSTDLDLLAGSIAQHPLHIKHGWIVNKFIRFNKRLQRDYGEFVPKFTELKLYSERFGLTGTIDRVDVRDNEIIVIDYKSGKRHPLSKFRFELAIYTILFEDNYKRKVTHWGVYFTDRDILVKEKVDKAVLKQAMLKVNNFRKRVMAQEFPKKPTMTCEWCSYYKVYCNGPE